jgi:hypothetical protein
MHFSASRAVARGEVVRDGRLTLLLAGRAVDA